MSVSHTITNRNTGDDPGRAPRRRFEEEETRGSVTEEFNTIELTRGNVGGDQESWETSMSF